VRRREKERKRGERERWERDRSRDIMGEGY
jgi:hypothetical protein